MINDSKSGAMVSSFVSGTIRAQISFVGRAVLNHRFVWKSKFPPLRTFQWIVAEVFEERQ